MTILYLLIILSLLQFLLHLLFLLYLEHRILSRIVLIFFLRSFTFFLIYFLINVILFSMKLVITYFPIVFEAVLYWLLIINNTLPMLLIRLMGRTNDLGNFFRYLDCGLVSLSWLVLTFHFIKSNFIKFIRLK